MKKHIIIIMLATLGLCACNESSFLEETPLDFMSGDNAYITAADFDAATTELYYLSRLEFYCNGDRSIDYLYGTDLFMGGASNQSNLASDYSVSGTIAQTHWDKLYLLISQANVIINRLKSSSLSDDVKIKYEAKAKFFRGFAYRTLAYLYGGVPMQLDEVCSPKTDYTRATKEETLTQALEDITFAAENLDEITAVKDGEISAPAAYVIEAELDLALGKNQEAIDAATKVIGNTNLALMTERFGTRKSEAGDVYWDLFRRGNQNRSAGNTEGIWVIQLNNPDITGGGSSTSTYFWTTPGNYLLERHCAPQVGLFKFIMSDGTQVQPFSWPIGDYTGGRGIGTGYPDEHFYKEIWESDWNNDIRNSQYNFVRKFKFNNTSYLTGKYHAIFGDSIDLMDPKIPEGVTMYTGYYNSTLLPGRFLTGYQTKCTTPFNHPEGLYLDETTYLLSGTAGGTYCDQYMIRLPEAYLLRAEAYLKLGDKSNAATDINVIRNRSHASNVPADSITMDYILDERMREFGIEEKRRLTLSRTGMFKERVTNYNPYYNNKYAADGNDYSDTYSLYPIPETAIEANKDATLEQNSGY
jgi:starch-binding outer membrane protein, SusD/RagB family